MPEFWQAVKARCTASGIGIFKIEKEKGIDQQEVALVPTSVQQSAQDTNNLKIILTKLALQFNMSVDFSAKPFADRPGSGLHIHVHMADGNGKNVFYKDDEKISDALKFSIGGLLATMRENMPVFAPNPASRSRFVAGGNAPLTVSWGANNRTVAVRLPDAAHDNKRIEHRVAGADADPEAVINAVLAGIYFGLRNKSDPGPQTYGDAGLEMYNLPKLF